MLYDDIRILDVSGDIGDHQCPCDLGGEGTWRRKTVYLGPGCLGLWGALQHLEQACYLPGLAGRSLQGALSGVCGLGFWGEVKSISSSGWMALKEWIPLH